jgi:Flp pilus assembly pilin Flp
MLNHLKRFLKDESGAAAIEYGLITSGISVAIIPGVKDVGNKLVAIFTIRSEADLANLSYAASFASRGGVSPTISLNGR